MKCFKRYIIIITASSGLNTVIGSNYVYPNQTIRSIEGLRVVVVVVMMVFIIRMNFMSYSINDNHLELPTTMMTATMHYCDRRRR